MEYKKIPNTIEVGGVNVSIKKVERCDNNYLGEFMLASGIIEIAQIIDKDTQQSETGQINTFYHELTHAILDTMGEKELSSNERFVCSFSGFLTEAMKNAYFKEE